MGNNRVVVRQDGVNVQNTDYYLYGESMAHSSGDAAQPYKFGGKEYDAMHGLNLCDFSARMKSDWGFTTIDPHGENYYSWLPYVYVGNNPMRLTDPTGKDWDKNEDGTAYMWRKGSDASFSHTIGEGDNAITMKMTNIGGTYVDNLSDGTMMVWNQDELAGMAEPQSFTGKNLP